MDEYLKKDPSITAPITSDSIHGIKRKVQPNNEDQDEAEDNNRKRRSTRLEDEKSNMEELRSLIKEQTETIMEIMKNQYAQTSEFQQKQHDDQMDIFRQ
ncbi:26056_t:CDS:2, partial [Gigaspora rosea]